MFNIDDKVRALVPNNRNIDTVQIMSNADDINGGIGFLFNADGTGAGGDVVNNADDLLNIGSLIPPQALEPQQDHHITQLPEEPSAGSSIDNGIPSAAASVENTDDIANNQLAPYNNSIHAKEPNNKASSDPNYLALSTKNKSNASKKSNTTKSKPAFVLKIWSMVNDDSNNDLIKWYHDGNSFIVTNRESFVQKILPKYFKHSNFASFVRQLNMYGWHKVQDASSGSLHSDEKWQFENKNFIRGKPELLDKIVRNKPNEDANSSGVGSGGAGNGDHPQFDVSLLIQELNQLKSNQQKITQELSRVRSDNELLWQELFSSREKNLVQNDKIEKILQFLASVYGNKLPSIEHNLGLAAHNAYLQNNPTTTTFYNPYQSNANSPMTSSLNPNQPTVQTPGGMSTDSNNPDIGNTIITTPKPPQRTRLMISHHRHVSNPNSAANTPLSNIGNTSGDSPIQEIVRTPSNYQNQPYTPNGYQNPATSAPSQQPFNNAYNSNYLPSDDFQHSNNNNNNHNNLGINQQLRHAQQQLHQAQQQQAQLQAQQQQQQQRQQVQQQAQQQVRQQQSQQQNNNNGGGDRPNVTTHQPSFDDLSRTIEEQGQSINDIISRIQQGQQGGNQDDHSNNNQASSNQDNQYETSSTTSSTNNPHTFDLDDFLNQEVYLTPGDLGDDQYKEPKLGTVREIYDEMDMKKHSNSDDEEDIEEIINPSKKRKSDGYRR